MEYKVALHNGEPISWEAAQMLERHYSEQSVGIVETMLWENGSIFLWDEHLSRLHKSLPYIGCKVIDNVSEARLYSAFQEHLPKDYNKFFKIRLVTFASSSLISISEYKPRKNDCFSWQVGFYTQEKIPFLQHPFLKTTARSFYNKAAAFGIQHGYDDMLLFNAKNEIIESTICNIFWVRKEQIFYPSLNAGAVHGTMQAYLLKRLIQEGIYPTTQAADIDTLCNADEIWLTNALQKMVFVKNTNKSSHECRTGLYIRELLKI